MSLLIDKSRGKAEQLQKFLTPELRYSQWLYEEALRGVLKGASSWLDVGCGHQVLPPWRQEAEQELVASVNYVVGVDPDAQAITKHTSIQNLVVGDVARLPFADCSFDVVTANMVVEHLPDPKVQFKEVSRVLKKGGVFLFHTPNLMGYPALISQRLPDLVKRRLASFLEDRNEVDVYPTYYRANMQKDIEDAAEAAGFEVQSIDYHCSTPALSVVPALAALELLYIRRLLRNKRSQHQRPVIIASLRKL